MYVKEVELQQFRNYAALRLSLHPRVNLLLGENAQGKTNLLEAVYICSMGRSFRTFRDQDMIAFGQEYGRVRVSAERDGADTSVELILRRDAKKAAKVDGVPIRRASQLLDHLYMVIFSPEDLRIVKDEPEKRRRFMDRELCQLKPKYYEDLNAFRKVLMQRNAYLKEATVDIDILDIWDRQLARYGASLMVYRKYFLQKLDGISRAMHASISGGREVLRIEYAPNVPMAADAPGTMKNETMESGAAQMRESKSMEPEETAPGLARSGDVEPPRLVSCKAQEAAYYTCLTQARAADLKVRTTTRGPHKDDMEFFIGDVNVRAFGSQGQQRTCALAVKLAELALIREETGEDAILLLDDVLSELDAARQVALVGALSDIQMLITTTEISDTLRALLPPGKLFHVEGGHIRET